jgi:hypothetical protein
LISAADELGIIEWANGEWGERIACTSQH